MNTEIEARFLEIDKEALIAQLHEYKAVDTGEKLLSEIIFYDQQDTWSSEGRYVRIRSTGDSTRMTYKHIRESAIDGATEIELEVSSRTTAESFLENIGLKAARRQEKLRHTFTLDGVTIDIDTWPNIPSYVEIEGPSEVVIRRVAEQLGFDWNQAVYDDARSIIETRYDIPVGSLTWFTFDRTE